MGGAFIEVVGKTKEEVTRKMETVLKEAKRLNLLDNRGITEITWDAERQLFVQSTWVHA